MVNAAVFEADVDPGGLRGPLVGTRVFPANPTWRSLLHRAICCWLGHDFARWRVTGLGLERSCTHGCGCREVRSCER